ncbi:MAG: hypothetical protein ACI3YA_07515 [Alloprevotella sp.]
MTVFPGLLSGDFLPIVLIFLLFPAIVKQQNRLRGLKIKNNQHLFVTKTPRFKPSAPLRRVWSVIGRDGKGIAVQSQQSAQRQVFRRGVTV